MIVHMMPGVGKTWLETMFPTRFIDTDTIYHNAGFNWKGRAHLLDVYDKRSAIMDATKIILEIG